MKKDTKITLVILGVVSLIVTGAFALLAVGFSSDDGTRNVLSQEEVTIVRSGLECDRLTKELRPTDKYCDNPEQYYEDIEAGLIEPAF